MIKISQSVINDVLYNFDDKSSPNSCPLFLKYRHVDNLQTPQSPLMLAGNYFEHHLLGATRDGIEPIIPRVNVKDMRPGKSATKEVMSSWLEKKGVFMTGTKDYLYERILTYPPEFTEGDPSTQQKEIDAVIIIAKQVLERMGLDTSLGKKQVKLEFEDTHGHLDWIAPNFVTKLEGEECIIDVKYTETKADDRYNGWADFQERTDIQTEKARTQAGQYIMLYHQNFDKWVPYYFFIFGRSGWVKIIKMTMLESGLSDIKAKQQLTRDRIKEFEKSKWKARPEYNKCMSCAFAAFELNGEVHLCPSRSITPSIENVEF